MSNQLMEPPVRALVSKLVRGEYALAIQQCAKSRLTAKDLDDAIRTYGRHLVEPPPDAYIDLDAVEIKNSSPRTWSVCVPLWSREEGRSDLTLELTISIIGTECIIEIDDLHVL